jgi:hypothetical protein
LNKSWYNTKIYSTMKAFVAVKADGSIKAWGNSSYGGTGAPSGSGYTKIYSNWGVFAALKAAEGAPVPPAYGLPHTLIEPSALTAAKALIVE